MTDKLLEKLRESLANNINSRLTPELATGIYSVCSEYIKQIEAEQANTSEENTKQ